jgi:Tfp pilus assembly protein PilF
MYKRALVLEPKLYEAALFIGDVYFKSADHANAAEWYGRAIAMEPDRETAYRYWGDSLMKQVALPKRATSLLKLTLLNPIAVSHAPGF